MVSKKIKKKTKRSKPSALTKGKGKTRQMQMRLEESQFQKLTRIAKKQMRSRAMVIRWLIDSTSE